jgi:8-oxo-dGTP diphosphatase
MQDIKSKIVEQFGNRLRVRVCGLCIENDEVLLVNHHSLNENGDFWGPPGGGMDFGSSAEENLKREFLEETGVCIEVEKFLFVHEYLSPPLHAIELIFKVKRLQGEIKTGHDPEMEKEKQIIKDVRFVPFDKIKRMKKGSIHQLFLYAGSPDEIDLRNGYFLWNGKSV